MRLYSPILAGELNHSPPHTADAALPPGAGPRETACAASATPRETARSPGSPSKPPRGSDGRPPSEWIAAPVLLAPVLFPGMRDAAAVAVRRPRDEPATTVRPRSEMADVPVVSSNPPAPAHPRVPPALW